MSSWSGALHFIFHTFLHPYHRNLFCCSINIMSSIPSLSLNSLLRTLSFTLTSHIYLTILISARWSATSFSFLTGQVSLLCSILLCTQLVYSLPLLINDISLDASPHLFVVWLTKNPVILCATKLPSHLYKQSSFLASVVYLSMYRICKPYNNRRQPFYGPLSRTTRVSLYQKKHPPTILIIIQSLSASSIYHDP